MLESEAEALNKYEMSSGRRRRPKRKRNLLRHAL